ncbi:hypothetical protein Bphy_5006 [Paraburkholderia phymatum STM815]|uniref:Uncharacterized protein n=2 Tax=Paraburkholderia phymatum TaxID=148447 RepID=B2JLC8_PARP8|nr:hypothetical protein Bphy_5006 [Paraburkholderia phymatum STM815]
MFSSSFRTIDLTGSPCIAVPVRTFVICDWKKNREGLHVYSDKRWSNATDQQAPSQVKLESISAIARYLPHTIPTYLTMQILTLQHHGLPICHCGKCESDIFCLRHSVGAFLR